jgi:hypothetical protein
MEMAWNVTLPTTRSGAGVKSEGNLNHANLCRQVSCQNEVAATKSPPLSLACGEL